MNVRIRVDSMKAAEHLASTCKQYAGEMYLRTDKFCVDPKSTLGILAMMYSAKDQMVLDTGELTDTEVPRFLQAISAYLVDNQDKKAAE